MGSMTGMKKKMNKEEAEILVADILTRGVGTFIDPTQDFKKKLLAKACGEYDGEIVVKFGVDPTRPDIHLGHAVILRKLRQLQDLGCKVVFLIGDITAQIGDPTGKSKVRPEIEQEAVAKNLGTYLDQIDKIIIVERDKATRKIVHTPLFSWIKNSDWYVGITDLVFSGDARANIHGRDREGNEGVITVEPNSFIGKAAVYNHQFSMQVNELGRDRAHSVTLVNILAILRKISLAQLIERDMFQERINAGEALYMHEMLYPVLQGTDSKIIHDIYGGCDIEIGGTDQTFNMLMGRKVMEIGDQKPQAVLSCDLLVGLDGKEKMSKSLDNYVGITDVPTEMFGKLMSIPDSAIITYFELCTFTPSETIASIAKQLDGGKVNPRDIKMDLAVQIVEMYHGREAGVAAREHFVALFQKKTLPTDIPEVSVVSGTLLVDILLAEKIVDSKTDFRRLLQDGAIRKGGEEKLSDPLLSITEPITLKIGKHRFFRFIP